MKIPNYLLSPLNTLIGKLKLTVYDDLDLIKSRKEMLKNAFAKFSAIKDPKKREEQRMLNSEITQTDFACFSLVQFKEMVDVKKFEEANDLELLEFWIVKR